MSIRIGIVLFAALALAATTAIFVVTPTTATAAAASAPSSLAPNPPPAATQQWSADQQSLLDAIEVCWDAWMDAVRAEDAEIWVSRCNQAEDASMWWTNEGAPAGLRMTRRAFQVYDDVDLDWLDFRPVAIRIWDDIGMVQFYGYWLAQDGGERVVSSFKRTQVYRRLNGQWQLLGGQGTPVTAADADPYQ